jgi:hypothetical protein
VNPITSISHYQDAEVRAIGSKSHAHVLPFCNDQQYSWIAERHFSVGLRDDYVSMRRRKCSGGFKRVQDSSRTLRKHAAEAVASTSIKDARVRLERAGSNELAEPPWHHPESG